MRISGPPARSAKVAHGDHARTGTDLDRQRRATLAPGPFVEPGRLACRPATEPVPVIEHQDVGPGDVAAHVTARRFIAQAAGVLIHLGFETLGRPDIVATSVLALQVMDRAVHLDQRLRVEARFLELSVDVGREHEQTAVQRGADLLQHGKARMRNGAPVEREAVAVEAPGKRRITRKGRGTGDLPNARPARPSAG
jgi:hypothetical protein